MQEDDLQGEALCATATRLRTRFLWRPLPALLRLLPVSQQPQSHMCEATTSALTATARRCCCPPPPPPHSTATARRSTATARALTSPPLSL